MKLTIVAVLLAATLGLARPSIEDPEVIAAFHDIVDREAAVPHTQLSARGANELEKRACDWLSPCCDPSTGCRWRDTCYRLCAGQPGAIGCVAGCATACPASPQC